VEQVREGVVAAVYDEWVAAGKIHDPPDDTSGDDDLAFWAEVDRRMAVADVAAKHRGLLDYLSDK